MQRVLKVFRNRSQPSRSLARDFGHSPKCRHFRKLAASSPVSGEEFWRILAEGRESRGKSLLGDFSISEIWIGCPLETGCVSERPVRCRRYFFNRTLDSRWWRSPSWAGRDVLIAGCGVSIEVVFEDGSDRAVGEHADRDGARCCGFQPSSAERSHQTLRQRDPGRDSPRRRQGALLDRRCRFGPRSIVRRNRGA
jgi:hypothetical protein